MQGPYHAMGNNPVSLLDSRGTRPFGNAAIGNIVTVSPFISWQTTVDGPPAGFTKQAMQDMAGYGSYTTDAMDMVNWAESGRLASFMAAVIQAGGVVQITSGG